MIKRPKKVGRPRLPKARAKSVTIQVRVNKHERKTIAAAAKADKKTVSSWARGILITASFLVTPIEARQYPQ